MHSGSLVLVLLGGLSFCPQAKDPGKEKSSLDPVLQAKVDAAIKKGVDYLKANPIRQPNSEAFVLWTLVHAGVPQDQELFQHLLRSVLGSEHTFTYSVVLEAMVLEELDR